MRPWSLGGADFRNHVHGRELPAIMEESNDRHRSDLYVARALFGIRPVSDAQHGGFIDDSRAVNLGGRPPYTLAPPCKSDSHRRRGGGAVPARGAVDGHPQDDASSRLRTAAVELIRQLKIARCLPA